MKVSPPSQASATRGSKRPRVERVMSSNSLKCNNNATDNGNQTSQENSLIIPASATSTLRPGTTKGGRKKSILIQHLEEHLWEKSLERSCAYPEEVKDKSNPSPLAMACREGAPVECITTLLKIAPEKIRTVLDSRGTPLHEAMVCEEIGIDAIAALIKADEALETSPTSSRATLIQDVDGFTPLHLLIRRRFQFHVLQSDDDDLLRIVEILVQTCPEAVIIPDRGEYEEPPIVYAIKANIYAPSLGAEDETFSRVELKIYDMVDCMLRYYPQAASCVFTGYRGQYTALHSAVFHGRCTDTIRLLLQTGALHPSPGQLLKPALLGNTQGEIPLHFCVMRGERPKSVDLIARAAPEGVQKRDASGLSPIHWLWIRFISALLTLDDAGRGNDTVLQSVNPTVPETNRYKEFWSLEQNDFELDLHFIRRFDPPVDFLRMRHIPPEIQDEEMSLLWASRVFEVLNKLRKTHQSRKTSDGTIWTRLEIITSLFWTKIVSLLESSQITHVNEGPRGNSVLVHCAFACSCCVPAVAWIVSLLFPDELNQQDDLGRLPVHYAAMRRWNAWDWPRDERFGDSTPAKLLQHESLGILKTALEISGPSAIRVVDHDNRLVLHHVIDTFVMACTCSTLSPSTSESDVNDSMEILNVIEELITLYPDSLQRRDGISKLFPFLQATARATDLADQLHRQEYLPLSMTYQLLRQNPTLTFYTDLSR